MLTAMPARPRPDSGGSPQLRVAIAERLLVAGLRAQERAEESEAARRRLEFLFRASQQLASSLDPPTVVRALAELGVPELGDGAVVHVLEPGRRGRQTTMTSSGPLSDCPQEWWDWLERVTGPGVRRATRLALPELGSTRGKRRKPPSCNRGDVSYLVVPLRARGRTLGTLSLFLLAPRQPYSDEDLVVAEALGNQAGLALDNAQVYEEQVRVVERLEEVRGELDTAQREWLREDERRRIARDLHDHVEQTFFAIGLTATAALDSQKRGASQTELVHALVRMGDLSDAGAEQLRAAIFALHNAEFAGLALIPALWKLVRSFQQRTGVDTDLVLTGSLKTVPTDVAEALHAIARESLANVERHAQAASVVLGLRVSPRSITLTVHDDGSGAPSLVLKRLGASTTHFGLRSLRERVRRLRGTFSSGPGPEGGFLVRARIPLQSGRRS
jgi:signal transduction histidine kinase